VKHQNTNKFKILNDPIYGFISIQNEIIFDLIEHPYFQRLRRISQLGLTYLVYPGAYHTRFHHALGAMHLTQRAIEILRAKNHEITENESIATQIAILLHDIGHGPFSHALENTVVKGVHHEELSVLFMKKLNEEFDGKLDLAISIFENKYEKKFLHDLISSQLDMDRLDYLRRDSFYTGVTEGAINSERLLTMLNVHNDHLVIDGKGIYSVEKFIVARRLMYWQVYLHKTVLSAEFMLVKLLQRARFLALSGSEIFSSSALNRFLYNSYNLYDFKSDDELLHLFSQLDDYDILGAIKEWCNHKDDTLRIMSNNLINRKLLKIRLQNKPFKPVFIEELKEKAKSKFQLKHGEENYFVIQDKISNHAYNNEHFGIKLLNKRGEAKDLLEVADQLDMSHLTKVVTKHFVCFPQEIA
jgi:HD superfamily phosphohydrolase